MPMHKGEVAAGVLAHQVADHTGINHDATKAVIDECFRIIQQRLEAQDQVIVYGFGTFSKKIWKRKPIYNFQQKQTRFVDLPFIRFYPSRIFMKKIRGET